MKKQGGVPPRPHDGAKLVQLAKTRIGVPHPFASTLLLLPFCFYPFALKGVRFSRSSQVDPQATGN
jgi:hypothetical protein